MTSLVNVPQSKIQAMGIIEICWIEVKSWVVSFGIAETALGQYCCIDHLQFWGHFYVQCVSSYENWFISLGINADWIHFVFCYFWNGWQPCHFPVMALCFVVLIYLNVFPIYLLVVLSLISIFLNIYWGWPSFGLKTVFDGWLMLCYKKVLH